jgi:hypothetical protein
MAVCIVCKLSLRDWLVVLQLLLHNYCVLCIVSQLIKLLSPVDTVMPLLSEKMRSSDELVFVLMHSTVPSVY